MPNANKKWLQDENNNIVIPKTLISAIQDTKGNGLDEIITDIKNKNNYSTDERVVGTWIDGRNVYEKTVAITKTSVGETEHEHGIQNVDFIWASESFILDNTKSVYSYSNFMDRNYNVSIYWMNSTKMALYVGNSRGGQLPFIFYIKLRYIKTID